MAEYSKYPNQIDTTTELPKATDNVTLVKAELFNRLRDALLTIEQELGILPSSTYSTVRDRLDNIEGRINDIGIEGPAGPPGPPGPEGSQVDTSVGIYSCDSSVNVNDVVYLSDIATVAPAQATSSSYSAIGMVVSKSSATSANVKYFGEVTGLTGLSAGITYFLSETAGEITTTPPSDIGSIIQNIGIAKSSTILLLLINQNYVVL